MLRRYLQGKALNEEQAVGEYRDGMRKMGCANLVDNSQLV